MRPGILGLTSTSRPNFPLPYPPYPLTLPHAVRPFQLHPPENTSPLRTRRLLMNLIPLLSAIDAAASTGPPLATTTHIAQRITAASAATLPPP